MKILLPVDGTELSLHETRFALQLLREGLKASFVLANVQEPASFYEVITARDPSRLEQMVIGTARELVTPAVKLLQDAGLSHEVAIVEEGDPVQGMLELIESEGCDMVIVGVHPHSLLESGSTRSSGLRLAKVSPVPVLSVRAPEPADPDRSDAE